MFLRREEVRLESRFTSKNIVYNIIYQKGRRTNNLFLPISKNQHLLSAILRSGDIEKILLLEELWLDDIVEFKKDYYVLKYEDLYSVSKEKLKKLDLPSSNDIKISIRSRSFLGNNDFSIEYSLCSQKYGVLDGFYERIQNIIFFDDNKFLLNENQFKLLEEIDNYDADNISQQGMFLAKVKKQAFIAGAELDQYTLNEQCYFPEELNIDIVKHNEKHIELAPYFEDLDKELNDKLMAKDNLNSIISLSQGTSRKRLFFDETNYNNYNRIKRRKDIKGSDVPKFINNPYEYLPESIDLEEFSDRVRGLKIRTYRAVPFVHCKKGENTGWFDFDTGINIRPNLIGDDVDGDEESLDIDEYKKMLDKTSQDKENYIYHNNKWIEIDPIVGQQFLEAEKKLNSIGRKTNVQKIQYVLDIYDNIGSLEYNTEFIKLKEKYLDEEVLVYEKPKYLNANLFTYQKEGFNWLKLLRIENLGGLLADDMGLGKTLQVIAYIAYLKEINSLNPSLIVVPAVLCRNWYEEIKKFTHNIDSIYIHKGANRIRNTDYIGQFDIVITSYETLIRDQIILGKIDWKLLVIDEAQKIKNATTLSATAVKAMKAKHCIAITGTPVENSLSELWSIVDYVQPGLLGSYSHFRDEFEVPIEKHIGDENIILLKKQQLISKVEPILLRRTKGEKLDNLPDKTEESISCQLSNLQEAMYMEIIDSIKQYGAKGMVLAYLQKLIQICSHPRLVLDDKDVDSDTLVKECKKLEETLNILAGIKTRGEKAIIFTKYKDMQRILRQTIYDRFGIWAQIINGEVTKNRLSIIKDFENKSGFNVLILSPQAAGVGLNIVGANHVIHYTREWNPAVENQATDRVYRIGQTRDVKVYYPICVSEYGPTVEVKLDELLSKKKILAKEIIIPMEKLKITEKEILDEIIGI